MVIRFDHFGKLFALSLALVPPAFSQAVEPGEKWRIKSSMSMMGMNMPSQSQEVCQPKAQDQVTSPVPTQKGCQISDMKKIGNKSSMKMTCTGEHPMTAVMETEYLGPEHYKGSMKSHMDASQVGPGGPPGGSDVTMNYEGENLHIACDAGEVKRQVAAAQAQNDTMMTKMKQDQLKTCADGAREANAGMFLGASSYCKDPVQKKQFCGTAQTYPGFLRLSLQRATGGAGGASVEGSVLPEIGAYCGFEVAAVRESLCGGAEGGGEMAFLAAQCPSQAATVAKAQCAGRKPTGAPKSKYDGFCSAFAANEARQDVDKPADKPADEKKNALQKTKDKLKGLLSF